MQFSNGKVGTEFTLQEILVYLATEGAFDSYAVPDWATGTTFEEVWVALRDLGERAQSYGMGIPPEIDRWFFAYCRGEKVPAPHAIVIEAEEDVD